MNSISEESLPRGCVSERIYQSFNLRRCFQIGDQIATKRVEVYNKGSLTTGILHSGRKSIGVSLYLTIGMKKSDLLFSEFFKSLQVKVLESGRPTLLPEVFDNIEYYVHGICANSDNGAIGM